VGAKGKGSEKKGNLEDSAGDAADAAVDGDVRKQVKLSSLQAHSTRISILSHFSLLPLCAKPLSPFLSRSPFCLHHCVPVSVASNGLTSMLEVMVKKVMVLMKRFSRMSPDDISTTNPLTLTLSLALSQVRTTLC
jgi:hypothetical protein